MRNETKIGLLAVVCIAGLIWGLKFLLGKNILTQSQVFYIEYEDIARLSLSSPVLISGFEVGIVSNISLKPGEMRTVVVELDIRNDVKVPKDAVVEIFSTGMMGDRQVRIMFERDCQDPDCAKSGDYLRGKTVGMIESMVDKESIDDLMDQLKTGISGVFDTLSKSVSDPDSGPEAIQDLKVILTNLREMTGRINVLLASSSESVVGLAENLESATANLSSNNQKINEIIDNASIFTQELANSDLKGTVATAQKTFDSANTALVEFQSTLESTNEAVGELTILLGNIKNGEGSIGKIFTDDQLYTNLEKMSKNLELLLQDFRLNPKRYVNVSVFGKKQKEYEKPEDDPAFNDGTNNK